MSPLSLRAFASRGEWIPRIAPYSVFVLVAAAILVFAPVPGFLTPSNLIAILFTSAIVGIMAVLSTGVVVSGGFDLSVGSVVALSGLVAAEVLVLFGDAAWPMAIVAALVCGALVGVLNGVLVGSLPVPPLIVTMGTMYVVRGLATLFAGSSIRPILGPEQIIFIGQGSLAAIPVQVWVFVALAALVTLVERRSTFGRYVYAIGSNPQAARVANLPIRRALLGVYVISGAGAGLAGLIVGAQVRAAAAYYGQGLELDVVTAILIGGASLAGGEGSALRSALGGVFVGVIVNAMGVMNLNSDVQMIVRGLIIVVAVFVVQRLGRASRSRTH